MALFAFRDRPGSRIPRAVLEHADIGMIYVDINGRTYIKKSDKQWTPLGDEASPDLSRLGTQELQDFFESREREMTSALELLEAARCEIQRRSGG